MAKKKVKKRLSPDGIGVKDIPTKSLRPNPHNPRVLFDRKPLKVLRESIEKVGILVPLTVFKSGRSDKYTILDGQRRWICAQELGLKSVPVNQVAEPTLLQNIVTMFQIHKLREDWELMPTALKVEVLMKELGERGDARLAELTGLDRAVVSRCKKLLSYPRKYQDMMLDLDPDYRVKADFFIELYAVRNDRNVRAMPWFKPDTFTRKMLERYQKKGVDPKAVTDFRVIKQHITNAVKAKRKPQISRNLRQYVADTSLSIDHLALPEARIGTATRTLVRKIDGLTLSIRDIDVENFYGEFDLWESMEKLVAEIRKKLKKADRRPKG